MKYQKMTPEERAAWRRSRRSKTTKAIEADLLLGVLSQSEIARKYGVTRQWVAAIKKRGA
jgi:hypothetical protein